MTSILKQTLHELELIIIEEPSASSGRELLADIQDPRVRHLVHPCRTSLVQQRNRGLVQARAEFVALLDADDIAEPERLQKQLDFLRSRPDIGVVGSQLAIIDPAGKLVGYRAYPCDHDAIVRTMPRYNPFAQPALMCRHSVLLDAGGYQYECHGTAEDYDLWCRLALRGVRFANHPEALVRYRIHPQAAKSSKVARTLRGTIEIKQRYFAGRMNFGDVVRLWGERCLLLLPASWVLRLFVWTQYRKSL